MTPEQAHAVANLAEALTECERVGMPAVNFQLDGDPDKWWPIQQLTVGTLNGPHTWHLPTFRLTRMFPRDPWVLTAVSS